MAKQNFVAGGFYGKLGEMVGQRWKNKRTLRVYVIPHDPKTPSQVAQRNAFAQGVPYAQVGLRFNKGAPCWKSEGHTEWMMRMGTAVNRIKAGITGDMIIPLWPDGYTPDCSVERVQYTSLSGGKWRIDFTPSNPVVAGRKMMLSLECEIEGTEINQTVVVMGDVTDASTGGVVIDLGSYSPVEGGRIFGVSCDDSENEDKMIAMSPQEMHKSPTVVVDDWGFIYDFDSGSIIFTSEKLKGFTQSRTLNLSARMLDASTGSYVQKEWACEYVGGSGRLPTPDTYGLYVMTVESRFGGFASVVDTDGTVYEFPDVAVGRSQRREISFEAAFGSVSAEAFGEVVEDSGETNVTLYIQLPVLLAGNALDPSTAGASVDGSYLYVTALRGGQSYNQGARYAGGYQDDSDTRTDIAVETEAFSVVWDTPQTGTYSTQNLQIKNQWLVLEGSFSGDIELTAG